MGEVAKVAAKSTRGTPAQWWQLVKGAASAWIDDYAPSMGAALSYYTRVLAGAAAADRDLDRRPGVRRGGGARRDLRPAGGLMGADAAKAIEGLLASVNKPAEGVAATTIGVVLLLIGATTVFGELQDALDRIWRAPARERSAGWWKLLRARLLSFGMILGIAFLLMVSLVLSAAISALGKWWDGFFGGWETVAQVVNLVVGFVLTAGVFAMIYKIMPRVQVRWHDVWLGARRHRAAVHDRQVPDRPVHRQERRRLGLRRRRLAGGDLHLGLLLGADLPAWAPSSPGSTPAPSARCARSARARRKRAMPTCRRAARRRRCRRRRRLVALAPRPIVARPRRKTEPVWRNLGIGLAAGVALRYIVPRLLRRR